MKKLLFTLKVFVLVAAFPLYFFAEVNHGAVKPAERHTPAKDAEALSKTKARLVVILNMPPAPESFVQD